MMKQIGLAVALFSVFNVFGQDILPMVYDTNERKQEFILNGGIDLSSTAIRNSLSTFFIRGGEITDEVTQTNYDNHQALNRIGINTQPELEYVNYGLKLFKSKPWGLQLKAGMLTSASSRYTSGLFGLAFLGNEPFLGQEVDLSNATFSYLSAHKIGVGLVDVKTKSSVTLNVYGIRNYASGYLNEAYFSQDAEGYNAEVQLSGSFETPLNSTFYKGLGVGVDANFILPITVFEKKKFVQFQLQNLGVGFLTGDRVVYQMDTLLNFNGFQVNQLIGDESILSNDNDVFEEIGLRRDTLAAKPIALPFTIQVGKIVDEHTQQFVQSFFGLKAFYQKGAIPLIYAGVQMRATDWLRMGVSANYGGFSKFRVGVYCQVVKGKFNAGIGTNNVIGMVSKSGFGHAYSLRLNYRL